MQTTPQKFFKDVAFVMYPVRDMKKARSFYESTLGLQVTASWQDQWVEYDIGGGTLALVVADETHKPACHGPTVGLEVVDFEAIMAHVKQHSVPIKTEPFDTPACRGCIIADPDGNELMLHARK
jgi:predicted enzyme related to lactoylglutathione lyase